MNIKQLRNLSQKKLSEYPYPDKLYRFFSIYFSWVFYHLRFSANQVTFFAIILGCIGACFFSNGSYFLNLIGSLIIFVWYILDYVDGEIARLRNEASLTGQYVDGLNHTITTPIIFLGVTLGILNANGFSNFVIVFGCLAAFGVSYASAISAKVFVYASLKKMRDQSTYKDEAVRICGDGSSFNPRTSISSESSSSIIRLCFFFYMSSGRWWLLLLFSVVGYLTNTNFLMSLFIFVYGFGSIIATFVAAYLVIKNRSTEKTYLSLLEK